MESDRPIKCGFCHQGTEVESVCGKLHYDNKDTAAHHKCMQYSADLVQYKFDNFGGFKIDKVEKEIKRGKRLKCSICKSDKSRHGKWTGASSGCAISNCSKTFHFYCAKLDDVVVTKRMEVRYVKENATVVMYRVFCGEAHYEQFKTNKGALKHQQKQLTMNCSDEEGGSGDEEQGFDVLPDSLNTQMDEDILMMSQLSPGPEEEEEENDSDNEEEVPADKSKNNSRVKETVKSNEQLLTKKENKLTNIRNWEKWTGAQKRNSTQFSKEQKQEEEERDDSSGVRDDEQNFDESSESELEDPFCTKSAKVRNQIDDFDNGKSDTAEDVNKYNVKGVDKLAREGKMAVGRKTKNSESIVRKGNLETAKQQKTPATADSIKSRETPKRMASSVAKNNVRGNNQKLVGQQRIITQAELHVTSSPSSLDEMNMEDRATSNDQGHSSDEESVMMNDNLINTPVPMTKSSPNNSPVPMAKSSPNNSPVPMAKSSSNSSLPLDEFSSESEWEDIKFPDCALAITSTTKVWPIQKNIIIQKAKELFEVQNVALWTQSDSFSDQLNDDHLPHFIKIIANMLREKRFKNLGNLLTECSFQHTHMESIKHLLELPNKIVDKIRDSLLTEVETQILNDETVLFMDTKLSTLFLKLNATVDRVCKIRNKLLPNAKNSLGCLYEWTKNTVPIVPLKQTDFDMELKRISSWLKNEGWNECELQIHPTDDIVLAPMENRVIKELIKCHKAGNTSKKNDQKKLIFVRAMDEMVNCSKYLQKLILSNANTKEVLIISHMTPSITQKFFIPTDQVEGAEVRVMSAFKPSTKQGISTIVICVSCQKRNTGLGLTAGSEDGITICPEDEGIEKNRKRKRVSVRTSTARSKCKRIN